MRKKNIAWNIIDEKTDATRGHTESTEITERKHGVPLLGWICNPAAVNISICNANIHRTASAYTRSGRIANPTEREIRPNGGVTQTAQKAQKGRMACHASAKEYLWYLCENRNICDVCGICVRKEPVFYRAVISSAERPVYLLIVSVGKPSDFMSRAISISRFFSPCSIPCSIPCSMPC